MKKYFMAAAPLVLAAFICTGCASTDKVPEQETVQELPVETVQKPSEEANEEYQRSTGNVDVSVEVFNEDKKQILSIIEELDQVMKSMNYQKWVTYLDDESIVYWSSKANLQKAASRLPVKGLKLSTLEDYFKYIFISSRVGRRVDEIRYETSESVKAVQVNDDNDTVYYNFTKVDGQWKLHLPPLAD